MTKGSEPTFMQRLEDWLTVLDGRRADATDAIDDFMCKYPKATGCGCITAIAMFFACALAAAIVERIPHG